MIIINNLDKYYGKTNVLKNINLKIEKSKITYLVGPNGSGKSTLIKAILGLIKKYSGTIEINGKIINGESEYRKIIGYMPQSASFPENLFILTKHPAKTEGFFFLLINSVRQFPF